MYEKPPQPGECVPTYVPASKLCTSHLGSTFISMPLGLAPKVCAGTGSTPVGPFTVLVSQIFKMTYLQSETGKDRLKKCA